jgi:type IV pilus assembly protein PilX
MNRCHAPRPRQSGAALVTVLVLLLVMTLLGIVGMRTTSMEERMSANLYDRSIAFQAAEAALREGERQAGLRPTPADPVGACATGLCGRPAPNTAPVWAPTSTVWDTAPTATTELEPTSDSPSPGVLAVDAKYIIEMLADDVPARNTCTTSGDISESVCTGTERRYRITARVDQADIERASVTLQSIYIVP